MFRSFPFLLLSIPLFAISSSSVVALAGGGQNVVYEIDASQRGTEILNMINSLPVGGSTQVPEVIIQTTLTTANPYTSYKYIVNGILPYVQKVTGTPNNTLLIITYQPPQFTVIQQYVVLPVEQISSVLYFPTTNHLPTSNAAFTTTYPSNVLAYFSVDPLMRSEDIAAAIMKLKAPPFTNSLMNEVWVQTNLNGPFNPSVPNGLLQNIQSVSASNGMLQIIFRQTNQRLNQSVIVTPEQVQQITWIRNPLVAL